MKIERIRLTEREKDVATILGTIPVLFFIVISKLLWKLKKQLAILAMIIWVGYGINYLAPKAFSPRADASRPFQQQFIVTLPMAVHPNLELRDTVLSLVRIEFGEDQVEAFDNLVTHESGWDPNAFNKSSGACGLFQSLPCNKMNSMTIHDQIEFGFSYIKNRYGNPNKAWAFWKSQKPNWY